MYDITHNILFTTSELINYTTRNSTKTLKENH